MQIEEWLGHNAKLSIDEWNKKYRYNGESFDEWLDRVSQGKKEYRQIIEKRQFLPGGRTLSNIGVDDKSSLFNCYSIGYVPDDYEGIMETAKQIGLTYKSQGGQGLSLSKLRPKDTPVGKRYFSDGIVPFMKIFNEVTEVTSQAGSRKGALLMSLDAWHKEAMNFITIKSKDGLIEKANLSLEIDNEFMEAVMKFYETGEVVEVERAESFSGHDVVWSVKPIEVFKAMVKNNYDWGDPGCIFVDRFRNYNIMQYDDEYEIQTSNPCSEQPLPKHGACCLGSINLAEFIENPYTDKAFFDDIGFKKVLEIAVRYMDDLVTLNYDRHPLSGQREMSYNYRNIGIGVMGYANALMKLGTVYGSREAIEFTDELFYQMFRTAVKTSSKLAKERGSFPKYSQKVWKSDIIRAHFTDGEIKTLKKDGLRNCSLLSIAPTGSLSNLLGVSGGCEPEYALKYMRRTVGMSGGKDEFYSVDCKSVQEFKEIYGQKVKLPKYFITATQINHSDRIATQSVMQKHVDTAISSTVNLPESATEDDIARIYVEAWKRGLKGVTIFRENCKRLAILTTGNNNNKKKNDKQETDSGFKRGELIHNNNTIGLKRTLQSGCGHLHCMAFFDRDNGDLVELYLGKGSTGGCYSTLNGLARMVSLSARAGVKIADIIEQLNSANVCPAYNLRSQQKKDTSKGVCCPSAIGYALKEMYAEMMLMIDRNKTSETSQKEEKKEEKQEEISDSEKCPQCGSRILHVNGCVECKACGYSKCG